MDRFDVKRTGGYDANYGAGQVETQDDFVVLKGSRAEADVVVKGLELLVLEQRRTALLELASSRSPIVRSYYREQIATAFEVLESIKNPNYVSDVKVVLPKSRSVSEE